MKTILKTQRFIVRQYAAADFNDFVGLLTDPEVRVYLPHHSPEKWLTIFTENLAFCERNPRFGRWGIAETTTGKLIGNCMLTPPREGLTGYEVGYAFEKRYWGTGAATEVLNALVEYAFEMPGLNKLYAITSIENVPSQKVLLKAGFDLTGKFVLDEFELPLYELEKVVSQPLD